jgi:hypothetical protein
MARLRPQRTHPLFSVMLCVPSAAACISVEERPRIEYLEAGAPAMTVPEADAAASTADSANAALRDAAEPGADGGERAPPMARGVHYRSGARLRAMSVPIEGGPTRIAGWFDTMLGASCALMPDAAGGTSCLPHGGANRYFRDAACAEPIWARPRPSCPTDAPLFGWETAPADACGGTGALLSVRRLTPSTLDPATRLYQRTREGCTAATYLTNYELLEGGDPLPWSSFVRLSRREKLGGTPDHESLVTDDGAEVPGGNFDSTGAACQLVVLDRQSYCLPTPYSHLPEGTPHFFADAICTQGAVAVIPSCAEQAPVVPSLLLQRERCSYALFRPSAPQSTLYQLATDRSCQASTTGNPNLTLHAYKPTELISHDSLTKAKRVLEGSGRFRVFVHRDDRDRAVFVEQQYRDTLLETSCRLSPLPGRGYYCPPERATTVYADAACTQPLLSVPDDDCAEPNEAFTVGRDAPEQCGTIARVVRRGAAFTATGPVFTKPLQGACMPTQVSGALYAYGADVPSELVGVFPIVTE